MEDWRSVGECFLLLNLTDPLIEIDSWYLILIFDGLEHWAGSCAAPCVVFRASCLLPRSHCSSVGQRPPIFCPTYYWRHVSAGLWISPLHNWFLCVRTCVYPYAWVQWSCVCVCVCVWRVVNSHWLKLIMILFLFVWLLKVILNLLKLLKLSERLSCRLTRSHVLFGAPLVLCSIKLARFQFISKMLILWVCHFISVLLHEQFSCQMSLCSCVIHDWQMNHKDFELLLHYLQLFNI